jgi:hypothetical protein
VLANRHAAMALMVIAALYLMAIPPYLMAR